MYECMYMLMSHAHLPPSPSSYLPSGLDRVPQTTAVPALDPKRLVARTKFTEEYFRARRKFSTSGEYCNLRRGRRFHWPIHADLVQALVTEVMCVVWFSLQQTQLLPRYIVSLGQ